MLRLTRAQSRLIDRLAVERYHMPSILLMENAARAVTDAAVDMLRQVQNPKVLIFCGGGNNGGDGLAVARHLHNRGVGVQVAVDPNREYSGDAAINWHIAEAMNLTTIPIDRAGMFLATGWFTMVIDALFGTGLTTQPRDISRIELMNLIQIPILSIDLPSGMDCDTGEPLGICVRATRTVTFVAEKTGFANPAAREYLGDVTVGDIGCPRQLIEEVARAVQ